MKSLIAGILFGVLLTLVFNSALVYLIQRTSFAAAVGISWLMQIIWIRVLVAVYRKASKE